MLLIMGINISPAMLSVCLTQDASTIPCSLDAEKSSPALERAALCHVERRHQEEQD